MRPGWESEEADRAAVDELAELLSGKDGEPIVVANEFAEVHLAKVNTRNGVRLLIQSPKSGQWVSLDPLELESLTWQNGATFSAMVGHPFAPLIAADES